MKEKRNFLRTVICALVCVAMVGMFLTACGGGSGSSKSAGTGSSSSNNSMQTQILKAINQKRAEEGLPPVTLGSDALNQAAAARAKELDTSYTMDRPNGMPGYSIFGSYGVKDLHVGEIFWAGYDSASEGINSCMGYDWFKEIILSETAKTVGIGCYRGGTYGVYWYVFFTYPNYTLTKEEPSSSASSSSSSSSEASSSSQPTESNVVGLNVTAHTKQEITRYIRNNGATFDDWVTYDETPVLPTNPGKLSQSTKKSALATLNDFRFIAGLTPVVLDETKDEEQQAACLVNALNGNISHDPTQPEGMDDDLFTLGHKGCATSNLSAANSNLNEAIFAMMTDGTVNDYYVGHRRWCLNPTMKRAAFGAVTNATTSYRRYYSMYAFGYDSMGSSETVAWPAQVTPIQYFRNGTEWSISIGKNVDINDVTVTVEKNNGQTWKFSKESSDGFFTVDNTYGQPGCIIFQPTVTRYSDGDKFTVTISGLEQTIRYTVTFFSLS